MRQFDQDFVYVVAKIRANLVGSVTIDHFNLHYTSGAIDVEWGLTEDQHFHFTTTISELESWEYSKNYLPIGQI